jgi:STE24 endopeptidase
MEWGGESFYIYLFYLVVVFMLIMMWLVPNVIMPLFNKYEDLPEGELKTAIEKLAGEQQFPLKKLYSMDGSKRSAHSNAFLYGFGSNKRIVLFDTLIQQHPVKEIVAILGHEIGHWKMWHVFIHLGNGLFNVFIMFYLFSLFIQKKEIQTSFGFIEGGNFIAFILFLYLYTPVSKLKDLFSNYLTRKCEF